MTQPSRRTALSLIILGLFTSLLGFLLSDLMELLSPLTDIATIAFISDVLYYDVGVGVLSWGIGWFISSISPLRKFYLYPIALGIGIQTVLRNPIVMELLIENPTLWWVLVFSVSPALIASGILAGVLVERRRLFSRIPELFQGHEKAIIVAIAVLLLAPYFHVINFIVRYLVTIFITWLVWHFSAPYLAKTVLLGFSAKGLVNRVRRFEYRIEMTPHPEKLTLSNIVARAYYPTAFSLSVSLTFLSIANTFGFMNIVGEEYLSKLVNIIWIAMLAMAVASVYVGPVMWLFEDSELRIFDRVNRILTRPGLARFADEFVELYAFIQIPISLATEVLAGAELTAAIFFTAMTIYTVFTASYIATLLYAAFSSKINLYKFIQRLHSSGAIPPPLNLNI